MRTVRADLRAALLGAVALLVLLAATAGLGPVGCVLGLLCAGLTTVLLNRAVRRRGRERLGPADRVTLIRAMLVAGAAALAAESFVTSLSVDALVAVASAALVLDAVDGPVARRTGTASPLGARFDMEVDAVLILVLSVVVARSVGGWVLAIGLARYVYVLAGSVFPWLRRPVPPRYWRKVVAAVQGVVLTVVAGDVLPSPVEGGIVAAAFALLAESFGRDVVWGWRNSARIVSGNDVPTSVGAFGPR